MLHSFKEFKGIVTTILTNSDSVDDIIWDQLPNKFVLKWNMGCGCNIICQDKNNLDIEDAKNKLRKWGNTKYYLSNAEMQYKYIPPKIICEKFIETDTGFLPDDYKIYCFNGKPFCVMVCAGREIGYPKFYYFDRNWSLLPLSKDSLNVSKDFHMSKPQGIDDMFKYAEILCKPFPFVRADFYYAKEKVIFGELTFTPSGGIDPERLKETDLLLGQMLELPR